MHAPIIGAATANFSVEGCPADESFEGLGFTEPTASDNCNGATVNIVSDVTSGTSCVKTFTRTWNATDACGNTSGTVSQTITVRDLTAPTIGAATADFSVEGCPADKTFEGLGFTTPTASDACNGATVNIVSDVTGGTSCVKTFTRTWNATDVCGNASNTVSQTITVRDLTAPTIGAATANFSVEGCPADQSFETLGFTEPTAADACNGATVNNVSDVTGGSSCVKTFTRTWNATDVCGNTSRSEERRV